MLSTGVVQSDGYVVTRQYGNDFQHCCNDIMRNLESLYPNLSNEDAFYMVKTWLSNAENCPNEPILTYQMRGVDEVQYFVIYHE